MHISVARLSDRRQSAWYGPVAATAASLATLVGSVMAPADAAVCSSTAACVFGTNTGSGPGVLGTSLRADGVDGRTSLNGTAARAASGIAGFDLSSSAYNTGVFGHSKNGQGVHGSSWTGTGVFGGAKTGTGVLGAANGGTGVHGTSADGIGVLGETGADAPFRSISGGVVGRASGTANGVTGSSHVGFAVYGTSTYGTGVFAESLQGGPALVALGWTHNAFVAESDGGFGDAVGAYAQGGQGYESGNGLTASAAAKDHYGAALVNSIGTGAYVNGGTIGADISGPFSGAAGIGIVGRSAAGSASQPLVLTDLNGNTLFYVDGNGDVYYRGTIHKFAVTRGDELVNPYSPTTTTPSIEDVGSARLVDGVASVKFDAAFARSIDAQYRVFLTPNGDTRGLYVAAKMADGFVVRETQGGRTSLAFDYRVVAAPLGHGSERMVLVGKAAAAAATPHSKPTRLHVVLPNLAGHDSVARPKP